MTATSADGERGRYLWVIPILFILAVIFSWLGNRQQRKDSVELEQAIQRAGYIADSVAAAKVENQSLVETPDQTSDDQHSRTFVFIRGSKFQNPSAGQHSRRLTVSGVADTVRGYEQQQR